MAFSSTEETLRIEEALKARTTPVVTKPVPTVEITRETEYVPSKVTRLSPNTQFPPRFGGRVPAIVLAGRNLNGVLAPMPHENVGKIYGWREICRDLDIAEDWNGSGEPVSPFKVNSQFETQAIIEIQSRCNHPRTRYGTQRIDGGWFIGDICQECELMINPFPDGKDSLQGS